MFHTKETLFTTICFGGVGADLTEVVRTEDWLGSTDFTADLACQVETLCRRIVCCTGVGCCTIFGARTVSALEIDTFSVCTRTCTRRTSTRESRCTHSDPIAEDEADEAFGTRCRRIEPGRCVACTFTDFVFCECTDETTCTRTTGECQTLATVCTVGSVGVTWSNSNLAVRFGRS